MLDFLFNDPVGHGIDIKASDIATHPVSFKDWRSAAHEGVDDMAS